MTSLVGLDPAKDLQWVSDPSLRLMDLFIQGKADAFLASPPDLQEPTDPTAACEAGENRHHSLCRRVNSRTV
jgi:hypothetical protein